MLTEREQNVVDYLQKKKAATMGKLRDQFGISHMTVVRALKKYGYWTSFNHNAAYYALRDVPRFDEWGLWFYRDVGFSKYGTLLQTVVGLVEASTAGLTAQELQERLQTHAANLVARLVGEGRLGREALAGRRVVYVARGAKLGRRQYGRRQAMVREAAAARPSELPPGCSVTDVIEVLRQMIVTPQAGPEQLARTLQRRGVRVTAGEIRRVIDYCRLGKKRPTTP
jgi:hypothetical protein